MADNVPTQSDEPGSNLGRTASLLGGTPVLGRPVNGRLEAHALLLAGLPGGALTHLLDRLEVIPRSGPLERAVGMSLRTLQRRKDAPAKPLSQEQSGRTWKFAEVLARTTELLGSQREAERWLQRPAIGLDRHRPIDLMATAAGTELVEDHLTRMEYGVYG